MFGCHWKTRPFVRLTNHGRPASHACCRHVRLFCNLCASLMARKKNGHDVADVLYVHVNTRVILSTSSSSSSDHLLDHKFITKTEQECKTPLQPSFSLVYPSFPTLRSDRLAHHARTPHAHTCSHTNPTSQSHGHHRRRHRAGQ